jgi:hypothetical protein
MSQALGGGGELQQTDNATGSIGNSQDAKARVGGCRQDGSRVAIAASGD